jgi:hypothetical protein
MSGIVRFPFDPTRTGYVVARLVEPSELDPISSASTARAASPVAAALEIAPATTTDALVILTWRGGLR